MRSAKEIPLEKRFKILCDIARAQHFAWREAALALAPQLNAQELINKMWQVTGVRTAEAYLKHLDPDKALAPQIAQCLAWSSHCMGEDVTVSQGEGDEAFVQHDDCPWYHWHRRQGLLAEDRPGCDTWFFTVIAEINKALGTDVRIETTAALPDGDDKCLRRIWVEPACDNRVSRE